MICWSHRDRYNSGMIFIVILLNITFKRRKKIESKKIKKRI